MIHHLFWPKITEVDHASDQAGNFDQGPTSTVEAIEKWCSPGLKLKLYKQAMDPFLPAEDEVDRVVSSLKGPVDRTEITLFLRNHNINRFQIQAETMRWVNGQ